MLTKEKSSPLEPVILIICPLIGIIKDQTEEAETVGLQACNLSHASADFKLLESMNLVFASAEAATDENSKVFKLFKIGRIIHKPPSNLYGRQIPHCTLIHLVWFQVSGTTQVVFKTSQYRKTRASKQRLK